MEKKGLAERGFDPRTSGLWAQHASTAPLCYRWWFYVNFKVFILHYDASCHANFSHQIVSQIFLWHRPLCECSWRVFTRKQIIFPFRSIHFYNIRENSIFTLTFLFTLILTCIIKRWPISDLEIINPQIETWKIWSYLWSPKHRTQFLWLKRKLAEKAETENKDKQFLCNHWKRKSCRRVLLLSKTALSWHLFLWYDGSYLPSIRWLHFNLKWGK